MPGEHYLPESVVPTKVWWMRNNCLGLFMVWARAYNDILDNSVLPTSWQQFGEGPLLIQHDKAPVHKAKSIQKCFFKIGVKELDWPAQCPDLNTIEHLWDELERRLRARSNRLTSVPDLTNALMAEWKEFPAAIFQHLSQSLPTKH